MQRRARIHRPLWILDLKLSSAKMKLVLEVITLRERERERERVVTRGRRISGLSIPVPRHVTLDQRPELSRLLTDALWSLYDQSKEELLHRGRDGEEKEKKTAHSEQDVVSLSDFARCQEDLRGMPASASVHAPVS